MHEGFDFWVGDSELDAEGQASLERANESIVPTTKMAALPSAYWVRIGERTHIRLVLSEDEDLATDALARLHAASESGLGEGTRLLGAFRACGLLVPVWDLDPGRRPPTTRTRSPPSARGMPPPSPPRIPSPGGAGPLQGCSAARSPCADGAPPAETPAPERLAAMTDTAVAAIIPAKDEADRIAATVDAVRSLDRVDLVVVVDDGSSDATADLARPAGALVVRHPRNRGKAAAMTSGAGYVSRIEFEEGRVGPTADRRALLFVDGDLEASAANLDVLIPPVASGEADMTIATLPPQKTAGGGRGFVVRLARAGIEVHRLPRGPAPLGHALPLPQGLRRRRRRCPAAGASRSA